MRVDERNEWHPSLVGDAGVDVVCVHLEEQTRHLRKRRRTPRIDATPQTGRPCNQQQVAVVGVVIRMVVSEEDMAKSGQSHSGLIQLCRNSVTAINDIRHVVDQNDLRRGMPAPSRPWSTASPQQDESRLRRWRRLRHCDPRVRRSKRHCHAKPGYKLSPRGIFHNAKPRGSRSFQSRIEIYGQPGD
jgi:hypothetical protein